MKDAEQDLADTEAEVSRLTQQLTAPDEMKAKMQSSLDSLTSRKKDLSDQVKAAEQRLKQVTAQAKPKDIVDIVVSEPIAIRVKPAEKIMSDPFYAASMRPCPVPVSGSLADQRRSFMRMGLAGFASLQPAGRAPSAGRESLAPDRTTDANGRPP